MQSVEQKKDVAKTEPAEKVEDIPDHDALNGRLDEPVAVPKVDPLASPTKGILLTPGTGATRRKTVSFGTLIADAQKKEEGSRSTEVELDAALKSRKTSEVLRASPRIQPRHSSLTKTLLELSKQKPSNQASSITSSEEESTREAASSIGVQTETTDQIGDTTVDLSQPRSRSGKHWKTEYEQYHKRSNREMKKMIIYGQNVKSYAVKKDSEATRLGEKLKKELTKVAVMEKKVSKLAVQLNNACAHGPEGDSEQTRLVSELAQQTALAIRYKEKADGYRRAMQKENRTHGLDGEQEDIQTMEESYQGSQIEADSPEVVTRPPEKGTFHAQMESLRMGAKRAEDQAAKLEAENAALKRSLARVKGEMMSYEARRQAREERLKRREAKCKADQKACEAQLAKLTVEHRNLLLASKKLPNAEAPAYSQRGEDYDDLGRPERDPKPSGPTLANGTDINHEPFEQNRVSKPYVSPRKSRSQKAVVDIWTLSSLRDAIDSASPLKEPTELPPSSVRHDIQRTLKEIDQNLIPEHPRIEPTPKPHHPPQANIPQKAPIQPIPQPQPGTASPTHHQKPPTINSPRSAIVDLTSSPAKLERLDGTIARPAVRNSIATVGRSSSLLSRVGSRTGTMTSARGSALSAERAAAAKARLAARSAEKRGKFGLVGRCG